MSKLKTIVAVVLVVIVAVAAIGILSSEPAEEPEGTPEQETPAVEETPE